MIHRIFLFAILLIGWYRLEAQTPAIESLKRNIHAAPTPEEKLKIVLSLCDRRQSLNADTLYQYASLAKKIAGELHEQHHVALANYYLASSLARKGDLEKSMEITDKNLEQLSYKTNKEAYVKFKIHKGQLFIKTNKFKEALDIFYDLLNQSEEQQDTLTQVNVKTNIGWVNMEMGRNNTALNWFYRAIGTSHDPRLNDYYGILYSNMAATYNELGRNDSAEYFIKKSIAVNRQNQYSLQSMANSLAIEADIFIDTKRKHLAEAPLSEALAIRKQIGEPFYIVSDMTQLALYYASIGQPSKGIALCNEGIAMVKGYGMDAKLPILYDALAENYKAAKNYEKYSETLQQIILLKDSLYEKNSAEALAELQTRYSLQKIRNTIIQQQLDITKKDYAISRRNYMLYGLLALTVFSLVIGFTLFKNYRRKQQMRMQLVVQEEKNRAALAVIAAEENERKRIAADLHDNLGAYAASIASNIDHIRIAPGDTWNSTALQELRNNSRSIVSQLNDTIWVLKKDALSLTAISDRLKIFIQRIQSSYPGMKIDVVENIREDHLLPPSQAFHLFNVLQEAVNNAVRHSGGNQVTVTIESNASWKIVVADNGRGFNAGRKIDGNGVSNMKHRSVEAGWLIEWEPNVPAGTRLSIAPTTK